MMLARRTQYCLFSLAAAFCLEVPVGFAESSPPKTSSATDFSRIESGNARLSKFPGLKIRDFAVGTIRLRVVSACFAASAKSLRFPLAMRGDGKSARIDASEDANAGAVVVNGIPGQAMVLLVKKSARGYRVLPGAVAVSNEQLSSDSVAVREVSTDVPAYGAPLDESGQREWRIGASLEPISKTTPAGTYSGILDVTVTYQ